MENKKKGQRGEEPPHSPQRLAPQEVDTPDSQPGFRNISQCSEVIKHRDSEPHGPDSESHHLVANHFSLYLGFLTCKVTIKWSIAYSIAGKIK